MLCVTGPQLNRNFIACDIADPALREISPDALQKCLRTHLDELQKRNIRSAAILSVFREYCYTPKHTIGEQLLQVREAKREQEAYESANPFQL
ncbi:MAG TPA: hypothetical protein VK638_56685 [Edaphobacter sp.]|nr:hypothetical protein [Edaphobacter sp.]